MSIAQARTLRTQQTDAENRLWYILRNRRFQNYRFRRQHPIGKYIADFACTKYHLIIEADGGQHADSQTDEIRTQWLSQHGWRVVRFWNNDILANTDGVMWQLLDILATCEKERAKKNDRIHPSFIKTSDGEYPLSRIAGEGGSRSWRETGEGDSPQKPQLGFS